MKIALGSDHAGFHYKETLKTMLQEQGHELVDCGTFTPESTDYPLYVIPAAEKVANGECERGIVLGGSGNGEAIAANKVQGIRCALAWNEESALLARQHNNANVLSLGERMISLEMAQKIVTLWLNTPFEGGRHERRVQQLSDYERRCFTTPVRSS
ncbi:MAG: ribose-5-phosphate isomerase [Verrucomicrobia bacterium RIFCSPHIGHO2_12_FULL_41_10]|nr:MAG: ribose-5-phosphate isomerase [Verrucomicrobia bacterium RIFCSPHIGHO2_12_FULL_41_10]HLB33014.1 ribose-5-phosphate isomerase [Chthoniobacterales bacterium]